MTVKVCDMIMGAGKTESAITLMNRDKESHYIFITPYLEEVERIKYSCSDRDFKDPQNKGSRKLADLHRLLAEKSNIASTHALFETYNIETISLIRAGGYKLILDEAFQTTKIINISQNDLKMLRSDIIHDDLDEVPSPYIEVDADGRVRWIKEDYKGKFEDLRDMCMTGNVILYNDCLLLWLFPADIFRAFNDVIILTYMFDAQVQKYYFDMNGIEIQKIGTVYERGEYHFCEQPCVPRYVKTLHEKIHIIEDEKLNKVGEPYTSLSSTWYERAKKVEGQPQIRQIRNNLVNVFINRYTSTANQNLWTVFKDYQAALKGKGYTKGFLSCNVRSTNAYRGRKYLAYCVNIFYNPLMKNYFQDHGVDVKEDEYALSEMIQWIWRSAIRDGEEIWVYVPSRRMRELLKQWLLNLSCVDSDE